MTDFRQLARSNELKLGTYIGEFATPGIGRILKSAGCEFAFVDMEHSGFSFETVKNLLRTIHDAGIATLLRPPSQCRHHLARACDIGAQGLIPPMLSTAEQARACVECIKYFPGGQRGCALNIAHDDYNALPVRDALARANDRTAFVALIETAEGVENSGEIARVKGLDCLWIGHLDLSISLKIPGEFDSPLFRDAVATVMDAAARYGVNVGRLVGSPEEGARLHREGCDFICYLGDHWLLQKALSDGLEAIRSSVLLEGGR